MTTRWTPFEIMTGTGAGFLCIAFASVFLEAGRIETELAQRGVETLDGAGLYWLAVEPRGRQLIVTGGAPDLASAQAAAVRVSQVPGVGAVDSRIAAIGAAGDCQAELDAAGGTRSVTFRKGQAELAPASEPVLAVVADVLERCGVQVEVAVHAEPGSSAALARVLTQRRAELVARRLVAHGVGVERLVATGYGVAQPVAAAMVGPRDGASTGDPDEEVTHRSGPRVEFRVLGAAT
jgi:outer membrane protein OmpA-like peptidoglycan-associated protein